MKCFDVLGISEFSTAEKITDAYEEKKAKIAGAESLMPPETYLQRLAELDQAKVDCLEWKEKTPLERMSHRLQTTVQSNSATAYSCFGPFTCCEAKFTYCLFGPDGTKCGLCDGDFGECMSHNEGCCEDSGCALSVFLDIAIYTAVAVFLVVKIVRSLLNNKKTPDQIVAELKATKDKLSRDLINTTGEVARLTSDLKDTRTGAVDSSYREKLDALKKAQDKKEKLEKQIASIDKKLDRYQK